MRKETKVPKAAIQNQTNVKAAPTRQSGGRRSRKTAGQSAAKRRLRAASVAQRRERAEAVVARLQAAYPQTKCGLEFSSPFELLVATVLSAQTTDARVNMVTPELFARYPTPQALADADVGELSHVIRSIGLYQRKAASLQGLGKKLVEDFDSQVPQTRDELMSLPGVGRKTANVVLGNCFGGEEITVDTHVGRISRRLGWAKSNNPLLVERELRELLPDAPWTQLCHQLIAHGRAICASRAPKCGSCPLAELCPNA